MATQVRAVWLLIHLFATRMPACSGSTSCCTSADTDAGMMQLPVCMLAQGAGAAAPVLSPGALIISLSVRL